MKARRVSGLRSEIVLGASLLAGAALLFSALLLLRLHEQERLSAELQRRLEQAQCCAQALATVPAQHQPALLTSLQRQLHSSRLRLGDGNGATASDRLLRQALLQQQPAIDLLFPPLWSLAATTPANASLQLAVPLTSQAAPRQALWLQFDLQPLRQATLAQLALALKLCLAYGLVLVLAAVLILQRAVIRPVEQLRQRTRSLAGGDFTSRAPVDGPREIRQLGESFNQMAEALQQAISHQQQQLDQLQQQNTELRATRQQLDQSARLSSVGRLASGMAHEIGNPLSAILGYLDLLRRKAADPAQQDLLQRSEQEARRIDRLIRDLLDYAGQARAQATDGQSPQQHSGASCDPLAVIQASLHLLQQQGALKQRHLDLTLPANLPAVAMAGHKLQQVLINLLLNARDATSRGGQIELGACSHPQSVEIWLRDNGCGMDEAQRLAAFDPFYSGKAEGQGRGLGLFVCHQLLHECGGDILLSSVAGAGSCFTLRLPHAAPAGDDA
ncbi:MAG: HAMP domain-containing sensor histidine kinase [Desulfuromonas thiophila]|jgi:signal transduction histidine kinase|nr:HAMP domain-containing sensor histidine kinase [Desulfuromonas thiophila]